MLRAAALILSTLAIAGCAADSGGEGFVILNNSAVTSTTCSLTGTSGQAFISRGQINSASPVGYVLTPFLQSAITATTGQELQRTIMLSGANVELTVEAITVTHSDGSSTTVPPPTLMGTEGKFQALFSGSLTPGGTANVAFEVLPVPTMHTIATAAGAGSGDSFNAEVKATVKAFGTMGGSRVDATPFVYPISVCNDCVVNDVGACPATGTIRPGNACNPFQDGPVDCCESGTGLVCPATM